MLHLVFDNFSFPAQSSMRFCRTNTLLSEVKAPDHSAQNRRETFFESHSVLQPSQ